MTWAEISAREGQIFCQRKDSWCAFVNLNDGSCTRAVCIGGTEMYCTATGRMCPYVDSESGECAAIGCCGEDE